MLKLKTAEGSPVHIDLPNGFLGILITFLGIGVSFVGWMAVNVVTNQRTLTAHEERIQSVERVVESSVTYREIQAVLQRMDRLEDKIDRLLEER